MRICIVGAGAIGGLLAARLAVAGQDVSVLARGDNLAAIRAHGLKLIEPDGSAVHATGLQVSDNLAVLGTQDLVVLALKAHQLPEIAHDLSVLYDNGTVVLPLQNGIPWWFFQRFPGPYNGRRIKALDPDGVLEERIPTDRIVASIDQL